MPTFDGLAAVQPDAVTLIVPAAHNVRFVFVAVGRSDPGYFASDATPRQPRDRRSARAAQVEAGLFAAEPELQAFFFRTDPTARPLARLAHAASLDAHTLTLRGRSDGRWLFGCTAHCGTSCRRTDRR